MFSISPANDTKQCHQLMTKKSFSITFGFEVATVLSFQTPDALFTNVFSCGDLGKD